ncbi:phosphoesterase family-domain-containing protein [Cristinia sonorae]|uniref:Phosphoesterase family-domain-containing protein n=1 Tax=Cristinia sonorae TaxID=1940300 RepID=A0A8K0XME5_9AGAR|nr:phosphoesterase family-domain-containing protein [Cristinia sonorae]
MISYAFLALIPAVLAAQAPQFTPPAFSPTSTSTNYVGQTNGTLPKSTVVPGKVFDRFTQIWIENTDFDVASTSKTFVELAKQGILLTSSYAVTHPSEPNYAASMGGDFFGMGDDDLYNIPSNISTIVDLLQAKNVSWAAYQENLPFDGYQGFNFKSPNYLNTSAPDYAYYVRKHNPPVLYDSITSVPERLARIRNFNDFAADVNASAIPQWVFVTPNMMNDAHDTDIDFASDWLESWLVPLLSDPNFNDNRTLILLTFDENETYEINNRIYSILLGGAIPEKLRGTVDPTYYTHYSSLSSVEANWGLGSLGRQDTNKFVADAVGYKNLNITGNDIPLTNLTGDIPGPLNPEFFVPFSAPNMNATSAGGGPVFVAPTLNLSVTAQTLPPPVNLTALNQTVPASGYPNTTSTIPPGPSPSTTTGGVARDVVGSVFIAVVAAGAAVFMTT